MLDQYSNLGFVKVIAPISPTTTGTITGAVIDTANMGAFTFVIMAGAQTTSSITVTPVVKSGTATNSLASAAAGELIGTEAAAALSGTAGAGGVSKIGYIGSNRYVQCNLVVANAATGVYSVVGVKGHNRVAPVS